jgi:chromosome segregation ATPase
MPVVDSRALCKRAIQNLNRRQRERINAENALGRLDENVANIRGEIQAAQSTLQRIVDQIRAAGGSAAGCATADKSDCIRFLFDLTREQARQEAKIQRLKDKLRYELAKRDGAKVRVDGIQIDIGRAQSIIDTHQCHRF